MTQCLVIRTQHPQQRSGKNQHNSSDYCTAQQCSVKTKGTYTPDTCRVLLTQHPRNQRGAALAEDVSKGHQQGKYRRTEGNTGYQAGISGCRDKVGIGKVIDHRNDHAEYQRQCKTDIRLMYRRIFKEFVVHRVTSFLYIW